MKRIFTLAFYIISITSALAQSSIEGNIFEQSGKQALEFSTISLYRITDSTLVSGTVSEANGKFILKDLSKGDYYLSIQFLGYNTRRIPQVRLSDNQKLNLGTIRLEVNQKLLQEVVVNGKKANTVHTIDKQVYRASQFQSSQGGTATDVIKNLPSVALNSEGEFTMRGSSGFMILLDGKPVQSDVLTILNQLPANTIENVEILTTPSSKYDPDGKGGIINIITKKGSTDGLYLVANVQAGLPSIESYGNKEKPVRFGGDFTANYKKGKWNYSLGANYKREDIAGYREGEAESYLSGIYTNFPSLGERSYTSYSYSLKGTVNYDINKANAIEAGFYGGKRSQFRTADIVYNQKRYSQETDGLINSLDYFNKNYRERKGDFLIANLNYTHTFSNKSTLALSGLYEKTILGGPTSNKDFIAENFADLHTYAIMKEDNPLDAYRFKADYILPIQESGKFEAGYQYRYLLHKGDFTYNQLNIISNTWSVRPELSNSIELTRIIHSLYSQYSNKIGDLDYTGGLRLEYIDRELVDEGTPEPYIYEKLNFFPSLNLLYNIRKGLKAKAGYSRRISQTTTNMMNPFSARRHSEVLETGDPSLLPEFINVTELGLIKNINSSSVFATFYYQGTQNVINRVNNVYNDTILNRTFSNAGDASSFGLELGTDLKPTDWWSIYAGGNLYKYYIKGKLYNQTVNRNSINYSFNANTTFKFSSTASLQLSVNYVSKTVTAQGEDSRFLIPSVTLKKIFLEGKASLSLQWQNIDLGLSQSNEQRLTTRGQGFYTSTNYIQEVDILRINFAYQLNKLKRKLKFTESEFGEKEF